MSLIALQAYPDLAALYAGTDSDPEANVETRVHVGAHVGAVSTDMTVPETPRAMYLVGTVFQGALAAALLMPFGFKSRHVIWGALFGAGAVFNLAKAVS